MILRKVFIKLIRKSMKFLIWILTISMLLMPFNSFSIAAKAAGNVCYIESQHYDSIKDAVNAATDGTTIHVVANASIDSTITVTGKSVTIIGDSNGFTLERSASCKGTMFYVGGGGTLSLKNIVLDGGAVWSGNSLTATAASTRTNSGLVATSPILWCTGNSTANLYDGAILQNNYVKTRNAYQSAAIAIQTSSTVNMYSGSVIQRCTYDNNSTWGDLNAGAIYVGGYVTANGIDYCNLNIDGGTIQSCAILDTGNCGSAITADAGGKITMSGNTKICDNWNNFQNNGCAAVVIKSSSLVIKSNSSVYDNIGYYGAVLAYYGGYGPAASLEMDDNASIYGNNGSAGAGGLYSAAPVTMSGNAAIHDNTTGGNGGGVLIASSMTMSGNAAVYGNSSDAEGGGIYAGTSADIKMLGGCITGNKAKTYGGGVSIKRDSKFIMEASGAPKIYSNTAGTGADDVYKGTATSTATLITVSEMQLPSSVKATNWYDDTDDARYRDISSTKTIYGDSQLSSITDIVKLTVGIVYAVTFDSQGGSNVTGITGVSSGLTVTKPTDPTKTGYIFDGWYTDENCTTAWDFSKNAVTSDITLYAKWTATASIPDQSVPTASIPDQSVPTASVPDQSTPTTNNTKTGDSIPLPEAATAALAAVSAIIIMGKRKLQIFNK